MKKPCKSNFRRSARLTIMLIVSLVMVFAIPFSGIAAERTEPVDLTKKCSVIVSPCGKDDDMLSDLEGTDITVDLYLVASAVKDPVSDSYLYEIADRFKDLKVPSKPTQQDWSKLAMDAAFVVVDGGTSFTPEYSGKAGSEIKNINAGLYLVVAHGTELTEYWEKVSSEEDEIYVSVAESSANKYSYIPVLVSVPTKAPDENGVINTANSGEWLYTAQVVLKPEQSPRFGDLNITKKLDTYLAGEKATFVFEVTIEYKETKLPSRIYTIDFLAPGEKTVTATGIPVGATVTVVEKYSGATYKMVVKEGDSSEKTAVISLEEVAEVEFENDYEEHNKNGYGVLNTFTYDEENGWSWNDPTTKPAG